MKNFLTFLLLSLTVSWISAEIDENGLDLETIAVRILLNKGKEPKAKDGPAHCTDTDYAILSESFADVLLSRRLRTGRELAWPVECDNLCKGYPRTQCFIVHKQCKVRRTLLEVDEQLEDSHAEDQDEDHRFLENTVSIAASNKCGGMKRKLEAKISVIRESLPSQVSEPCMNLVNMDYRVACAIIGTEGVLY
jgi:hypothetical protein